MCFSFIHLGSLLGLHLSSIYGQPLHALPQQTTTLQIKVFRRKNVDTHVNMKPYQKDCDILLTILQSQLSVIFNYFGKL